MLFTDPVGVAFIFHDFLFVIFFFFFFFGFAGARDGTQTHPRPPCFRFAHSAMPVPAYTASPRAFLPGTGSASGAPGT